MCLRYPLQRSEAHVKSAMEFNVQIDYIHESWSLEHFFYTDSDISSDRLCERRFKVPKNTRLSHVKLAWTESPDSKKNACHSRL
jgi:hypothetical protein